MSWQINFVGKRDAVAKAVRETKAYGDASQFEAAQEYIVAEIGRFKEDAAVLVKANGHHDEHGNRYIAIAIERAFLVESGG